MASDILDDVMLVSPWGAEHTTRHAEVVHAIETIGPEHITHIYGHSLGGAVARSVGRLYPNIPVDTFAAPLFRLTGNDPTAHRIAGDPIAFFDMAAGDTRMPSTLNPHGVGNFDSDDDL